MTIEHILSAARSKSAPEPRMRAIPLLISCTPRWRSGMSNGSDLRLGAAQRSLDRVHMPLPPLSYLALVAADDAGRFSDSALYGRTADARDGLGRGDPGQAGAHYA